VNAFFMGAGSSYGTLRRCGTPGCPPLAVGFGKALASVSDWEGKYPSIKRVADALGRPLTELGLEAIWSHIDYCAKLGETLPPLSRCPDPIRASPDLKRALLLLYGRECDNAAGKLPLSEKYTLGCLLKNRLQPGDVIISFNYDTVVERLAKRFGYALQSVGGANSKAVTVVKPHGSASWCLDLKAKTVTSTGGDGSPLLESLSEDDVSKGLEPLLLGAVPIKSELIREVQETCGMRDVFHTIKLQWRAVVEAVRDADAFIVVGYSFPKEDQYGRFLLREGALMRSKPIAVDFYEVPAHRSSTEASIMEAFPAKRIHLAWKGEVKPHSGTTDHSLTCLTLAGIIALAGYRIWRTR